MKHYVSHPWFHRSRLVPCLGTDRDGERNEPPALVRHLAYFKQQELPHTSSKATGTKTSSGAKSTSGNYKSTYAQNARRDAKGRIARSTKAKDDFKKQHPCPSTGKSTGACPGYVIDHLQALKHRGADKPSNMQWQTVADSKKKDKTE